MEKVDTDSHIMKSAALKLLHREQNCSIMAVFEFEEDLETFH